jgi:hypothetical protein
VLIPVEGGETKERQKDKKKLKEYVFNIRALENILYLHDDQQMHNHKYVTEHIYKCAFVGNHISVKYNRVYIAARVYTMAITKTDLFITYIQRGKLKVILVASVRSVTIQAKSALKDTIISDNEETLEGFVQNGGKCLTIVVQLGRGIC